MTELKEIKVIRATKVLKDYREIKVIRENKVLKDHIEEHSGLLEESRPLCDLRG